MKRLRDISDGKLPKDATWTLFRTNEAPDLPELLRPGLSRSAMKHYEALARGGQTLRTRKIRVLQLWKKMIEALFETGHPWITFKDPCNVRSPQDHAGVIHNSNLCTEIDAQHQHGGGGGLQSRVASISRTHLTGGWLDRSREAAATVRVVMRMLDNVIDMNYYPVKPPAPVQHAHRPVGPRRHGHAGRALRPSASPSTAPEAVDFNDEIMEAIAFSRLQRFERSRRSAAVTRVIRARNGIAGLLPLDTLDLLEQERGVPVMVDRKSRLDWNGLREKIRRRACAIRTAWPSHRPPPSRISLRLHALHRAELQAYSHQVEPLRRVRPHQRFPGQAICIHLGHLG